MAAKNPKTDMNPTETETKPDEIEPTHLVVRAIQPGFRRAGRAWSEKETTVPVGDFDADQIAALLGEPMLVVVLLVASETPEK